MEARAKKGEKYVIILTTLVPKCQRNLEFERGELLKLALCT